VAKALREDISRRFAQGVKMAQVSRALTRVITGDQSPVITKESSPELYDLTMQALDEVKEGKTTEWL
jgi:hypothetical protein